jgi:thiamine monophosphate synthase
MRALPSPLYVILDRSVARGRELLPLLEAVIAGGGRLVQLREKGWTPAELWPVARALRERCPSRPTGSTSGRTTSRPGSPGGSCRPA